MKDIRTSSQSNHRPNRVPIIRTPEGDRRYRIRSKEIDNKVAAYERGVYEEVDEYRRPPTRDVRKPKKSWKLELYALFALVIVGVIVYLLTFVFNSATLLVKERAVNISQNGNFVLTNSTSSESGNITKFEKYEVTDSATTEVKKSSSVDIKSKAKGYVTIYNNYDKSSQKLVKNTRLQTADGKIFRIDNTVIVPGKSENGPGSIKALAVADTYGSEYNIAATEFTIPGFKGGPKYSAFYAKSDGAMSGGDVGKRYYISAQDLKDAETKLIPDLEKKLKDKIKQYKDDNYIVVTNSLTFQYKNNKSQIEQVPDMNNLEETVTASIIIVKKSVIAETLAKLNMPTYNGVDEVKLRNYDVLKLSLSSSSLNSTSSIELYADYRGDIVWNVQVDDIRKELVGKNISEFPNLMSKFVGVDTAKPVLRPMWVHSFPNSEKRITITLE